MYYCALQGAHVLQPYLLRTDLWGCIKKEAAENRYMQSIAKLATKNPGQPLQLA